MNRRTPLKRSTKPLRRSRLRPVSKKHAVRLRDYTKVRREYMEAHPICEVQGCTQPSTECHHKAGRGSKTADRRYFMATCNPHHRLIHRMPSWARENGYLL
jgi:hypothetical protein